MQLKGENMGEEIKITTQSTELVKLIAGLALVFVIGFALGNVFPVMETAPTETVEPVPIYEGLLEGDKNFLIGLANNHLMLSPVKNDWCLTNGGFWNETIEQGELPVDPSQLETLKAEGITVTQKENGYFAQMVLIKRDGCIFPAR